MFKIPVNGYNMCKEERECSQAYVTPAKMLQDSTDFVTYDFDSKTKAERDTILERVKELQE